MSPPRSPRRLVLIAAIGAVSIFTACSGSSSSAPTPSAGTTTSAPGTPASVASGATSSDGQASPSSGGSGGATTGAGSLSTQATGALGHDFTISYAMNGSSGAATAMTIYWDASTKNWRVDTKSSAGTITLMNQGNSTIYCLDTEKTCTRSTAYGSQTSQIPFFSEGITQPNGFARYVTGQLGTGVTTSSKMIAGVDATCYDASSGAASGAICFGQDDLILAWTGSIAGEQISLLATKVDNSVKASDFDPPYKVTGLGNVLPP